MDGLIKFLTDGHVLAKMLILQAIAAALALFLLKKFFDRELFSYAMEQLSGFPVDEGPGIEEIAVLSAGKIAPEDVLRLTALARERFPRARIIMAEDASLWGGLVMRAGQRTLDCSLSSKIKQLFRITAA